MPKEYEAIRDSLMAKGKSAKEAKGEAARIWNSRHPDNPNPWTSEKKGRGMFGPNPYKKDKK